WWVESRLEATRARRVEPVLTWIVVILALWAIPGMLNIVNPITVLVEPGDMSAMDWIRSNVPANATFLVNERLWLPPIYSGTDGGYWIPNLTGRRTTMPIVFYILGPRPSWHDDVNVLAQTIASGPEPDSRDFLTLLRARGVTHVYIGAKGGPLPLE